MIGIWGSYNQGNYGDDLMAILFSKQLEKYHEQAIVYRLDESLADLFGIKTTNSLDEFMQKSKICLIGGGGMLIGKSWIKQVLSKTNREFQKDFKLLLYGLKKYNRSIYGVSIGGAGVPFPQLGTSQKKLFQSDFFIKASVRLEQDLEVISKFGKTGVYYPDILLSAGDILGVKRNLSKKRKIRVGLNIFNRNYKGIMDAIDRIKAVDDNFEFIMITSHLKHCNKQYEYNKQRRQGSECYEYSDPKKMLELLLSLDVLISSKLHLGVTALSVGTLFVSYCGADKTKSFMKSIAANDLVYGKDEAYKLVDEVINKNKSWHNKYQEVIMEKVKDMSNASKGHIDFIRDIIDC